MTGRATTGVLIFEGMTVGVLPGDLKVQVDEHGAIQANLVLSTAYNVLPIWIRVANDQLRAGKIASEAVRDRWSSNDKANKELLIAELEPCMQVIVACGIALDALYDQLKPFAKLTDSEVSAWRKNKTARAAQIGEVVRRVYRLDADMTAKFKRNITGIFEFRDLAVHPSLELKQTCTRPDLSVGIDWRFSAYRYSNAEIAFRRTMEMLIHIYEKKSNISEMDAQMERVFAALEELSVVTRNTSNVGVTGKN